MRLTIRISGAVLVVLLSACTSHQKDPAPVGHFGGNDAERTRANFESVLSRAAAEPGAVRTRSGMVYRELVTGRGAEPSADETVTVRYQTKTESGEVVASSAAAGGPVTVIVEQVGACEREALLRMRAGGTSRFICPLPETEQKGPRAPRRPVPLFIEVTLIEVGAPLPPQGH